MGNKTLTLGDFVLGLYESRALEHADTDRARLEVACAVNDRLLPGESQPPKVSDLTLRRVERAEACDRRLRRQRGKGVA